MKAVIINQYGGPEVMTIQDHSLSQPGAHEVLVQVKAAGVNPVDTYLRSGSHGYAPQLPFTPGEEGAGVLLKIGNAATGVSEGDRVYVSGSLTGTYAEQVLCRVSQVRPLPEELSFEQGAALFVNYGTAYRALFQRGGGTAGERVLVHGATGGVGVATIQWALRAGLEVVATFGSAEGEALLHRLGVTQTVQHNSPDHADVLRNVARDTGFDLIVEMLANANLELDLSVLARNGRIVVVGSRGSTEITPRQLMGREADIRGLRLYSASQDELNAFHAAVAEAAADRAINPVIQRQLPLAEAPEAHRSVLEDPSAGKIVLIP